jgi:hypothetical protein
LREDDKVRVGTDCFQVEAGWEFALG